MKTAFVAIVILLSTHGYAGAENLGQLRDRCAPTASLVTLSAIVSAESERKPQCAAARFSPQLASQVAASSRYASA